MIGSKWYKEKRHLIIKKEDLENIDKEIKSFLIDDYKLSYTFYCSDGIYRKPKRIEEIIEYDNNTDKAIRKITLSGESPKRETEIEISFDASSNYENYYFELSGDEKRVKTSIDNINKIVEGMDYKIFKFPFTIYDINITMLITYTVGLLFYLYCDIYNITLFDKTARIISELGSFRFMLSLLLASFLLIMLFFKIERRFYRFLHHYYPRIIFYTENGKTRYDKLVVKRRIIVGTITFISTILTILAFSLDHIIPYFS